MLLTNDHYSKLKNIAQMHFKKLIDSEDKDLGLSSYYGFYNEFIKTIEHKSHYEKCFEILDKEFINFCTIFFKNILINKNKKVDNETELKKIFFIVPNLANSLAHITFLKDLFFSFNKYKGIQFFLVSNTDDDKIKAFKENYFPENELIFLKYNFKKYDDIVYFYQNYNSSDSRYVVWALPLLIPLWVMLFDTRVCYASLKFKYECFHMLKKGIQFNNQITESSLLGNTRWINLPLKLPDLNFPLHKKPLNRNNIKFLSVNRSEKINNPFFLETIKSLLIKYPNSTFSFSGKELNTNIDNFFKINNINHRSNFLGWVDPKSITNEYDIFIDAPYLSGVVSANYFVCGMPVITYASAESSYINCSHDKLIKKFKIKFTFSNMDESLNYIDKIVKDDFFRKYIKDCQLKSKEILMENKILGDRFIKAVN